MRLLTAICVLALALGANAQVGDSGIIDPSGRNIQFSHDFANEFKLIGPSGIVSATGENIQLSHGQAQLHNNLPGPADFTPAASGTIVGASGFIRADGTPVQLTLAQVMSKVLAGPSGIVFSEGGNVQFRKKRAAPLVGSSGYFKNDGTPVQFTREQANGFVLAGPGGIVFESGKNIQHRKKRAFSDVKVGDVVGAAGIVFADGRPGRQLTAEEAASVVVAGPSGAVTTSGNYQYAPAPRARRSIKDLYGPSGAILDQGRTQVQFKKGNAKLLLEGPSAYIFDDGTLVQKY